LNYIGL